MVNLTLVPKSHHREFTSEQLKQSLYIPFLVTELAVCVYIRVSLTEDETEEERVDSIRNQFHRSGVPNAEPFSYGLLNDPPKNTVSDLIGTVDEIIERINHEKI